MRFFLFAILLLSLSVGLIGCGAADVVDEPLDTLQYGEILATKSPYAVAKEVAPVLTTHEWDRVFGGEDGKSLAYDKFGEIDELEFIAPKGMVFYLKRQIRKKLRKGETIFFQVSSDSYSSPNDLWIDGRFLDVRDILPEDPRPAPKTRSEVTEYLRSLEGASYTWNGNFSKGVPELLEYYAPSESVSERLKNDWKLSGVDTLGALFEASGGATALEETLVIGMGESVYVELETEEKTRLDMANQIIEALRPLDVITFGERSWVVLDKGEVFQSKYESNFSGGATIGLLLDTVFGLLQKRTFVREMNEELEDSNAKKVVIRRWYNPEDKYTEEPGQPDEPYDVKSTEDILRLRGAGG